MTVLIGDNTSVAWRVRSPDGQLGFSLTGISDADNFLGYECPVTPPPLCGGSRGSVGFWLGGVAGVVEAQRGQVRLYGAPDTNSGAGGTDGVSAGDYFVIVIFGGGSVPVGLQRVQLTAPPGASVLGFSSGPASEFTEADFGSSNAVSYQILVATQETADGSIPLPVAKRLFGAFLHGSPDQQISYTDPSGAVHGGDGFWWIGADPGEYALHLRDHRPTRSYCSCPFVFALVASVSLP